MTTVTSFYYSDLASTGTYDAMVYSYGPQGGSQADPYINNASIPHAKSMAAQAGFTGGDIDIMVSIACYESFNNQGTGPALPLTYWIDSGQNGFNSTHNYGILQVNEEWLLHGAFHDEYPGNMMLVKAMSGAIDWLSGPNPALIMEPWLFAKWLYDRKITAYGAGTSHRFDDWGPWTDGHWSDWLTRVQSASGGATNYPTIANGGMTKAVDAFNGVVSVGQDLSNLDLNFYCYEPMHAFNTANIGGGSVSNGGTFLTLTGYSNNGNGIPVLNARQYAWGGTQPSTLDFQTPAQLAALPLLGQYNTNGGFNGGQTYPFTNVGMNDTTINRFGLTKIVLSSTRHEALVPPTGHEYVTYYSGDSGFGRPMLTVTYTPTNTIPVYTSLPVIGAGVNGRVGPSNPTWTVIFAATDAQQSGTNQLTWVITPAGGGATIASGTFTSGQFVVTPPISYVAAGLANGPNNLWIDIRDGVSSVPTNTASITLYREDESPTISTVTTLPSSVLSANYSVVFTPSDPKSTNAGELAWWVYTGSNGTGTLLATGSASTGVQVTAPVVDAAYAGATRYVRVRNGAGAITQSSIAVSSNQPPVFTTQPTANYGALTGTGPANTFTVKFAATDVEQTGANQLTYRVFNPSNTLVAGPTTFTSSAGLQTSSAIAYTQAANDGLTSGWYVTVTDGASTTTSSTFSVFRDSGNPQVGFSATVPAPLTSTTYSVRFTAADLISSAANDLTASVRTASGGGGSLLGLVSATASPSVQTIGPFVDSTVGNASTRWLRLTDRAGNAHEVSFVVSFNTPPTFSAQPTVQYGSGTRTGPRNSRVTVSFTAQDAEQTGANALQFLVVNSATSFLIGSASGTCTSGVPTSVQFQYNDANMAAGDTAVRVSLSDGNVSTLSNAVTVKVDIATPTSSTSVSTTPTNPTSTHQAYTVTFTPSDAASTAAGELLYQINSVATLGTGPGPGDLLGGAGGIACTSGTPVTTASITTDTLVNGTNGRFVRVGDGAGNWSETAVLIVANLAAQANLVLATVAGSSSPAVSAVTAGKPITSAQSDGHSFPTLRLSSLVFLSPGPCAGAASTSIVFGAGVVLRGLLVPSASGAVMVLSTPVRVALAGSDGSSTAAVALTANSLMSSTVAGVSTATANLDATKKPAFLTPGSAGSASGSASLAATHVVPFLAPTSAGSAGVSLTLTAPRRADLVLSVAGGDANTSHNFRWVGGHNMDFDAVGGGSTVVSGLGTPLVNPDPVAGVATVTLSLLLGVNAPVPPVLFEARALVASPTAQPAGIESFGQVSSPAVDNIEARMPIASSALLYLTPGALGGPALPLPIEVRTQVSQSLLMNVEARLPVTRSMAPNIEAPAGIRGSLVIDISSRAQTTTPVTPVNFEALEMATARDTALIEARAVSQFQLQILETEFLLASVASGAFPLEVSVRAVASSGSANIESLLDVPNATAAVPIEAQSRRASTGSAPIEAEGFIMAIGPDSNIQLIVQKRLHDRHLHPHRAGNTVRTFRY